MKDTHYTKLINWVTKFRQSLAGPKGYAILAMLIGLVVYWLGFGLPFLIIAVATLAIFMPMPQVFNSWFSRSVMALFFLYAAVQIAALAQVYIYPAGGFALIAGLEFVLITGLLVLFGRRVESRVKIFTVQDKGVLLACLFFMLPFFLLVKGEDRLQNITEMAGVQVVDSVMHEGNIASYMGLQTVAGDYQTGRFYPVGFHIATSFIEKPLLGDIWEQNWKARVAIYLGQFLIMGSLLMAAVLYFCFSLLNMLGINIKQKLAWLAIAGVVGVTLSITHMWLFVSLGFLNYYYICAAVLLAACYLLGSLPVFKAKASGLSNIRQYAWPIFAFLLIAFGASYSWPLLVPPILLSALLALLAVGFKTIWQNLVPWLLAVLPVAAIALIHLLTVYIQTLYMDNEQLITMGGALHNFNALFLIIGTLIALALIAVNLNNTANRLVIVLLPFVLLVAGLTALHLFAVGEPNYYLIKSAMILEMMLLALMVVTAIYVLGRSGLPLMLRQLVMASAVVLVVLGTVAVLPQPLQEVRGLFRNWSGMGKPPFLQTDSSTIVQLAANEKLRDFNMTILHYDPAADRFYSHMQTAVWAQTLAKPEADSLIRIVGGRSMSCFSKQFVTLSYGQGGPEDKATIINSVKECAQLAKSAGRPYYVVTDPSSLPELKRIFGDTIVPAY